MATSRKLEKLKKYCRDIATFEKKSHKPKPESGYQSAALFGLLLAILFIMSFVSLESRTKAIICQDSTYYKIEAENFAEKKGIVQARIYYFSNEVEARQKAQELKEQAVVTFAFAEKFNVADLVEQQYYK